MSLLNPVFNCFNNQLSSSVDKVTTGTYNFVVSIANVASVGAFIAGLSPSASLGFMSKNNFQTKSKSKTLRS